MTIEHPELYRSAVLAALLGVDYDTACEIKARALQGKDWTDLLPRTKTTKDKDGDH